jgi:hypothetical protein
MAVRARIVKKNQFTSKKKNRNVGLDSQNKTAEIITGIDVTGISTQAINLTLLPINLG